MCGIAGIVDFGAASGPDLLKAGTLRMLGAMDHRGPDGSGVGSDSAATLGAVRLAIRGLGDGNQPLVDPASGVTVVCNGEIDNHRELRDLLAGRGRPVADSSDVAVILPLFLELGEACIERLSGAFALAIWDPRQQVLFLARDRAGERPIFYCQSRAGIAFASELQALAHSGLAKLDLDPGALAHYLRHGYTPPGASPMREILSVRGGEVVRLEAGGESRRRYWRWTVEPGSRLNPDLDRFDTLMRAAVWRQSEVDVDFGVFLSGGLDSSLIAALSHDLRPQIRRKAFVLRFAEDSYDEGLIAARVADSLGMECVPVWVGAEDVPVTLARLIQLSGLPLADPAWVPTALLAQRARQDVKLALVGEGADELFGGYPTYVGAAYADQYARLPGALRTLLKRFVQAWPASDRKVSMSFLLKRFVQAEGLDGLARHRHWVSNISPALLARLGLCVGSQEAPDGDAGDLLDRIQTFDLENSLAESLLAKADRAGMSASLELRAPFLDPDVMAFAASLPPEERVRAWRSKVFLKRYALRYLPEEIVHRRKRGLSVPLSTWLRGPLYAWARSRLQSERLTACGLRLDMIAQLLEEHRLKREDHGRALWTLIVLSEWLDWRANLASSAPRLPGEIASVKPSSASECIA